MLTSTIKRVQLIGAWHDWSCDREYLFDYEGNRYLPGDIKQTFYGRHLHHELHGSPYTIRSMKQELESKIIHYNALCEELSAYSRLIQEARRCFG